MERFQIREEESIISLICNKTYLKTAKMELKKQRNHIKNYIAENPLFKTSLRSSCLDNNAPLIIKKMINASIDYDVGPMAAVAGAISEMIILKLIKSGADEVIIDNGGDIALFLQHPCQIGLYAGNSNINGYGFRIETTDKLLGICTSSGKIGHSRSFGISYSTTVFSDSPSGADGAATKIGNLIKKDDKENIKDILETSIQDGISGIVVTTKNYFGKIGVVPEIIKTDNCFSLITRG